MKSTFLFSIALLFLAAPAPAADTTNDVHKILIVLVGDSTVNDEGGWGYGFKLFLTPDVECTNTAANGRSSKSFIAEGRWANALALHGDYYLIQFGHNDEPGKGPDRETDPATTYPQNLARYVDDVRAIGGKPILVTPLTRRNFDKSGDGKLAPNLMPYVEAMKRVAAGKNVPLLDLHADSVALCEKIGPDETAKFNPVKDGKPDTTHLYAGARLVFARLVVEELRQAAPELVPVLRAEPLNHDPAASNSKFDAVVSADGSGTYTNLHDAIAAAPDDGTNTFAIRIKPGTYNGQFIVPREKRHLKFIGDELENTVLTGSLNQNEPAPGGGRAVYNNASAVVLADDFHAENITFQNTSGDHGQALALRADGDRNIFNHCRFLGWQDTLLVNNGRYFFTNCYVEGRVDFIYGSATAIFDRCEIHSKNGGHVTAANTPKDRAFGLVFMDCKLTGDPKPWVSPDGIPANTNQPPKADLGRPWRPYASVTYLNCEMGGHIKPEGWNNWRNPANELTARFAEYHSTGPGANQDQRFEWARQLSDDEAKNYTIEKILGGPDPWQPDLN